MAFVTEETKILSKPLSRKVKSDAATIAAVFTGGTIAVNASKASNVVPALSGREIMERVPEIAQHLPSAK